MLHTFVTHVLVTLITLVTFNTSKMLVAPIAGVTVENCSSTRFRQTDVTGVVIVLPSAQSQP